MGGATVFSTNIIALDSLKFNINLFVLKFPAHFHETTILLLQVKQPILFLSGLQDELVPPVHMRLLYEKAIEHNSECLFVDFPNGMHMDTWYSGGDRYWRTINLFLQRFAPDGTLSLSSFLKPWQRLWYSLSVSPP